MPQFFPAFFHGFDKVSTCSGSAARAEVPANCLSLAFRLLSTVACVMCTNEMYQCKGVLRSGGLSASAVPAISNVIYIPALRSPPVAAKRPPACGSAVDVVRFNDCTYATTKK